MNEIADIVQARFSVILPGEKWITRYSNKFPRLSFTVLSMLLLDNNKGNVVFQVEGRNTREFILEFKQDHIVESSLVLYENTGILLLNVTMSEPLLLAAFVKTSVPIRYPIVINQGKATIELIASRQNIDQFFATLERDSIIIELHRIGRYEWSAMLSDQQLKTLELALHSGYFEVPRDVELRHLASTLGIAPSTLSENLRRIYKILATHYTRTRNNSPRIND